MKKLNVVMVIALLSVAVTSYADVAVSTAPAATAAPTPASSALHVDKIAVGTGIDNKEISGEAAQFDASATRVYCWTRVTTDSVPVTIKHVWSVDGQKEAEVPLDIKYLSTRTWSSKTVRPGAWKVEVTDDKGTVLSSKEFTVSKAPVQVGQ